MHILSKTLIGLVALIHSYILVFEMFLWQSRGPKVFSSFPPDLFEPTTAMAANQGIYNLCLAAGLIWSLLIRDAEWQRKVATGFLLFVATAGLFGAWRVSTDIALVQAGPAVIGLLLLWLPRRKMRP